MKRKRSCRSGSETNKVYCRRNILLWILSGSTLMCSIMGVRSFFCFSRFVVHGFAIDARISGGRNLKSYSERVSNMQKMEQPSCHGLQLAWNIGDLVTIESENNLGAIGNVTSYQGRGWYNVMMADGSSSKIRSSKMKHATRVDVISKVEADISSKDSEMDTSVISDLDQLQDKSLQKQLSYFSSFQNWVVFSDLHVSVSTLDTCLEVLERVHAVAVEQNAGIVFLGDWWHVRGTLRVDMLNAVLSALSKWKQPMICIPGNHDQVTLQATENHGLQPLQHAYRCGPGNTINGVLILSHATRFMNALWVPHMRFGLHKIMESEIAIASKAIFCHVDVTGASMNDLVVSCGGVSPKIFPTNVPVFTGHFHKPHTVSRGSTSSDDIEYVGSPYQVSLSEAGQEKALMLLDSKSWTCVDRIPIHVGPKHFRVNTLDDFLEINCAKAGDRIVFSSCDIKHESPRIQELDDQVRSLRKVGATVEIRQTSIQPKLAPIETKISRDDMSPRSLWLAYLKQQRERGALPKNDEVEKLGLSVIEKEDLDSSNSLASSSSGTNLQIHSVSCKGFGPFRDEIQYPLNNRGLVLLRGRNNDIGSDSNGSGKTSLAISILWALTGSVDPRPVQDAKVADIVNDLSKHAIVRLEGELNDIAFTIVRTKTASKGSLSFTYNGEDLTTQSLKHTQQKINEKLGMAPEVLSRILFHGQHAVNDLLIATDAKLKEELSLVVPMEIWKNAAAHTRVKAREATKLIAKIDGMISIRLEDVKDKRLKVEDATMAMNRQKKIVADSKERVEKEIESLSILRSAEKANALENLEYLESSRVEYETLISDLEQKFIRAKTRGEAEQALNQKRLDALRAKLDLANTDFKRKENELGACTTELEVAKERTAAIEKTWQLDLSQGMPKSIHNPTVCPTCLQEIASSDEGHSPDSLRLSIRKSVENSLNQLKTFQSSVNDANIAVDLAQDRKSSIEDKISKGMESLADDWKLSKSAMDGYENELNQARDALHQISFRLGATATKLQYELKIKELQVTLDRDESELNRFVADLSKIQEEVKEYEERLLTLQSKKRDKLKIQELMTTLSSAFGQRGIQTYSLQNAVTSLQSASQTYLDTLSEGAQRLELSLDSTDTILRRAFVSGEDNVFKERALASLSGGQWRRCSLAVNLAFSDLVARRGRFRTSLCVLDEPLTHLDAAGRASVGRLLRGLLRRTSESKESSAMGFEVSTIIIILQDLAAEELEESFDHIDDVVKENGSSTVVYQDN